MISVHTEKPHAVLVPYPAQGHINPMMQVAKLLHSKGFYITFVNTEYNRNRLLRSRGGPDSSVINLHDFRFEAIPDGLLPPPSEEVDMITQDLPTLCDSTSKNCLAPFLRLLDTIGKNDSDVPSVTCIVADGCMSFALDAAKELDVPSVLFWTTSACGFMAYLHLKDLFARGLAPVKDLSSANLDTPIDFIPGMNNMRIRDYPSFVRTADPDDKMLSFLLREAERTSMASAIILNTFRELEVPVLDALMSSINLPPVYTIGPLHLLTPQIVPPEEGDDVSTLRSSLWKEETSCLEWLQEKEPGSVLYVNFGSITVMTKEQLVEFAWGLAESNWNFLWVIRPDLVREKDAAVILSEEFLEEIAAARGLLTSWCQQEEVLSHSAIGGFLTHCGWNSTLESISAGVPMICWPFCAEQQTNCRYLCSQWDIGMEIDTDVRRDDVKKLIRELMGGEKGKEMRKKVLGWEESASRAKEHGGSSFENFGRLIKEVLLTNKNI